MGTNPRMISAPNCPFHFFAAFLFFSAIGVILLGSLFYPCMIFAVVTVIENMKCVDSIEDAIGGLNAVRH